VPGGTARRGDFSLGSSENLPGHLLVLDGNADIYGHLRGNLVTVRGDVVVHAGGVVSGDVLTLGGEVRDEGGEIGGEVRTLRSTTLLSPVAPPEPEALSPVQSVLRRSAGVLGVFLTLSVLGFGLVMFGRQNLEIVSDTVSHSFGRAFLAGLLGQILLLPTFGMLVVGLILSVAGILLLPFAVAVFALLAVIGIVGGYLAVAHAMGETYTRRRMALGVLIGSPNSYRYLLVGLLALLSLWAAWALFGWVPVAGSIIWGAAFFVSWLLGTAGFGAALLSRAGIKENFAGRFLPPEALTDEYLWATPQFGVPAGRKPGTRTPTRGA
jgi:MFS family permease